jgi:hypothetical protein
VADWLLQNYPSEPKISAPKPGPKRGGSSSSTAFGMVLVMVVVLGAVGTWVIQRNRATVMKNATDAPVAPAPKSVTTKPTAPAASAARGTPTPAPAANAAAEAKSRGAAPRARATDKVNPPPVSDPAAIREAPQPAAAPAEVRDEPVPAVAGGLFDMSIYGPETPEVAPPSGVYIRWPTMPTDQQVGAIQVVVSQNGAVESARPLTNPRTLSEYIVVTAGLSAAKTWRFRPALKDGRPVKYRMVVAPGNHGG